MPIKDLKGSRWRVFPSTREVAFYDSFAQYIELSEISPTQLRLGLNGSDIPAALQSLPLLAHELQHWCDHLSTLWGRQRLVAAFEAMHARVANDPSEFWRIARYRRLRAEDRFEEYYSTVLNRAPASGPSAPWQWQLTAGLRFDAEGRLDPNRPIFFITFSWPDGSPACRVPFSAASLLECNAMAAEWQVQALLIDQLPEDVATVEAAQAQARNLRTLYTPELGAYMAPAHLVGNLLQVSDVMEAYRLASLLAALCLNLPSEAFPKLKVPHTFRPWGDKCELAKANYDRGFAFLALAKHGQLVRPSSDSWLEETCLAAGLPPIKDLEQSSNAEAEQLRKRASVDSFASRFDYLWRAGAAIREQWGFLATKRSGLGIPLPPLVCAGGEWVLPSGVTTDAVEAWWSQCNNLAGSFNEFIAACAI